MPESSWPTQNQPNGIFENFLSYFALLGRLFCFTDFVYFCFLMFVSFIAYFLSVL